MHLKVFHFFYNMTALDEIEYQKDLINIKTESEKCDKIVQIIISKIINKFTHRIQFFSTIDALIEWLKIDCWKELKNIYIFEIESECKLPISGSILLNIHFTIFCFICGILSFI